MNNFNPITRAASAAWAELTTDDAKQWYTDTAWTFTLSTWATLGNLCNWLIATLESNLLAANEVTFPMGNLFDFAAPVMPMMAVSPPPSVELVTEIPIITPPAVEAAPAPKLRGRKPKTPRI